MSTQIDNHYLTALANFLRPIVRFCLKRSVRFQEFVDVAKRVFIEIGQEELQNSSIEPSNLRLSVMTGLQRRDVSKIVSEPIGTSPQGNLIARVIGLWANNARYLDKADRPRALSCVGRDSEFGMLVTEVSLDLNPYAVLNELERVGAAKRRDGTLCLLRSAYEPMGRPDVGYELLAADSSELFAGVLENVDGLNEQPNLHSRTFFDNIPARFVPVIRKWLLVEGGKFHARANQFLSKFDRDINPELKKYEGRYRASLGTFSRVSEVVSQTSSAAQKVKKKATNKGE